MIVTTLLQLSLPQLGATCALHLASLLPASHAVRPALAPAPDAAAPLTAPAAAGQDTQDSAQRPGDRRLQHLPVARKLSRERLAVLRRELSELRIALAARADHDAAWEGLQDLIPLLLMPPPASAGLLEQRKLGLETLDTLLEVIAHRDLSDRSRDVLLDTLAASAPEDEEVLLRVRAAREDRAPDESERIDAAVIAAIDIGDQAFLQQLGSRAVPGLRKAFLRDPDAALPNVQEDALMSLAGPYPLELSELVGETLDHTSFYYRRRVMRAIENSRLTSRSDGYAVSQGTPPPFLGTGALRFFERYVNDPDIGEEVRTQLTHLMRMDALSPRLAEALVRLGREGDAQEIEQLVRMIQRAYPGPKLQGTLVRLLEEGQPPVRRAAAVILLRSENVDPVLALAGDPDPELRRSVTYALGQHRVYELEPDKDPGDLPNWRDENRFTPQSPLLRQAALRLLRDEEPDIRVSALEQLRGGEVRAIVHDTPAPLPGRNVQSNQTWNRQEYLHPLPAEVLLERVGDDAPEMRHQLLAYLNACPLDTRYRVLQAVARASDPADRRNLAQFLYDLPWWEQPDHHVAMLELLVSGPDPSLGMTDQHLRAHLHNMRSFQVGVDVLAEWILRIEDDEVAHTLLNAGAGRGNRTSYGREWLQARADLVPPLLARMTELDPEAAWDLTRYEFDSSVRRAAFPAMATVEPVETRLLAGLVARDGVTGTEMVDGLVRTLAMPGWETLDEAQVERARETLSKLLEDTVPEDRNRLAGDVLDRGTLHDELAYMVLIRAYYEGPSGTELGRRVLARYFEGRSGPNYGPTYVVLRAMSKNAELRDMDVLHRAARLPGLYYNALPVLGDLRDPASLPVIAEVIRSSNEKFPLELAAQTLTGYLSDEAAELLLEVAAKAPDETLRESCLAKLDKIRAFQDARERWATRRVSVQTREQVIAELLVLLREGPTRQRQEAARALATWEAVEAMPELIRLLSDANPDLSAAAAEALDRLNAVRVPEDGGADGGAGSSDAKDE